MNNFLNDLEKYGFRVAVGNQLIIFTKLFLGAKRIQITQKGREVNTMPKVGKKHFPYTKKGIAAAKKAESKMKKGGKKK